MSNDKNPVYMIYLRDPEYKTFQSSYYADHSTMIYGITNQKKLIKKWKQERNMDLFRIKKIYMSNEEYEDMMYDNSNLELRYMEGKSKDSSFRTHTYQIVVTEYEHRCVEAESAFTHFTLIKREIVKIPNKILTKQFRVILYYTGYWYYADPAYHDKLSKELNIDDKVPGGDLLPFQEYKSDPEIDLLAVFVKLYKKLLRK